MYANVLPTKLPTRSRFPSGSLRMLPMRAVLNILAKNKPEEFGEVTDELVQSLTEDIAVLDEYNSTTIGNLLGGGRIYFVSHVEDLFANPSSDEAIVLDFEAIVGKETTDEVAKVMGVSAQWVFARTDM